jgi:hypothetical protein
MNTHPLILKEKQKFEEKSEYYAYISMGFEILFDWVWHTYRRHIKR